MLFRFPDKPIETGPNVVKSLPESLWIAQAKYDGWRMLVFRQGKEIKCLSRVNRPMEETGAKFDPNITKLFEQMNLPENTIIDTEFVGPRNKREQEVYIFDILAWNGQWLTNEPYSERWKQCKSLLLPKGNVHLAETVEKDFIGFFSRLKHTWIEQKEDLHEGIVLKLLNGKTKLDRNNSYKNPNLLKLKYREICSKRF